MEEPKVITSLGHLTYVFRAGLVSDDVRIDVSQRVLDWLATGDTSIHDSYILQQCKYIENYLESDGVDIYAIFE